MAVAQVPGAGRKTEPLTQGVKVRAIELGYYDHIRRRPGDVFFIDGAKLEQNIVHARTGEVRRQKGEVAAFSKRWMELVPNSVPENKPLGANDALKVKQQEMRSGKATGDQDVIG